MKCQCGVNTSPQFVPVFWALDRALGCRAKRTMHADTARRKHAVARRNDSDSRNGPSSRDSRAEGMGGPRRSLPLLPTLPRPKSPRVREWSYEADRSAHWTALSDESELFSSFYESNTRHGIPYAESANRYSLLPSQMPSRYPVLPLAFTQPGPRTNTSSTTSGSSPMFSDLGTVATRSPESLGRSVFPRSEERVLHGLGLVFEGNEAEIRSEEAMQAYQRRCLEESRISLQRALRSRARSVEPCSTSTPIMGSPVSSTSTAVGSADSQVLGMHDASHYEEVYRPRHSEMHGEYGLRPPWFHAPLQRDRRGSQVIPGKGTVLHTSSRPSLAGPSLRPLRLVSLHAHEAARFQPLDTKDSQAKPYVRSHEMSQPIDQPPSPGALHGLNDAILQQDELANHLRPLCLPARQEGEVQHRIPRLNLTPELVSIPSPSPYAHRWDDTLSSTSSKPSSRKRVPFVALHPPVSKESKSNAERLFWYGFLGMPWLWLLGGWGLDDAGALLSPWSTPSFSTYRSGLHPYGPPFSLAACAKEGKGRPAADKEIHRGLTYLRTQRDAPSRSLIKPDRWKHVEVYVMYNRIAAALSAFAIFACWGAGIWAVVAHF